MNNTLRVQKEARERELKAANETIITLQNKLNVMEEEISRFKFCKIRLFMYIDMEDSQNKANEIMHLKALIEEMNKNQEINQK